MFSSRSPIVASPFILLSKICNVGKYLSLKGVGQHNSHRGSAVKKIIMMLALLVAAHCEAASWQLTPLQYETSKIPMELAAPRAGLSTANRYYKAYPGLLYRVPVVVLGGAYPYQYALTAAPSGMTVGQHYGDADYGIINWTNPTTGTSSVTVQVTDQQGTVVSVNYSITVTTAGFIFVDSAKGHHSSANGGTGTGTLANPFLTMDDFYSGTVGGAASYSSRKADTTYSGYFVYYRAGTYATSTMATEGADNGLRSPFVSGNKPKVHLAYPGETATINTSGAAIIYYGDNSGNYYMGGLSFAGLGSGGDNKAWEWDSGVNDIGSFECNYDASIASSGNGSNAALMMSRNNGYFSNYVFMSHNTIVGLNTYDIFLGYQANKFVAEGNTISNNIGDGHGFYAKITNQNWSIRGNVGLIGNSTALYNVDGYSTSNNIEVSWNNYKSSGDGASFGLTPSVAIGTVWQYRNTWQVGQQHVANMTVTNLLVANDVLTYTGGSANTHGWFYDKQAVAPVVTAKFSGEECVLRGSSCTDTSGKLTGTARTNYLGVRGFEIGLGVTPPVAPPVAPPGFTALPAPAQ